MAMDDSMAFMGQMECGHLSIQQQLQNQASITIQKNRAILKSVLKAIIFCGKQNISLRGKNAQYRSPKIQNDLIAAVEKWIQQKLTQEIKAAKFFTVLLMRERM